MNKLKMIENKYPGVLISFCGIDGSGKSTHLKYIAKMLCEMNIPYFIVKEPTATLRNNSIFRNYIDNDLNEDYSLLSVLSVNDRIRNNKNIIIPALKQGKVVLCDRYFYSCLAHNNINVFKNKDWIYDMSKKIIKPDISFFFDIPTNIAIQRVRSRKNEKNRYINVAKQTNLNNELKKIALNEKNIIVNTLLPKNKTIPMVMNVVYNYFNNRKGVVSFEPTDNSKATC